MRLLLVFKVDLAQLILSTNDSSGKSICLQHEAFFLSIDLLGTFSSPAASCTASIQQAAPFPQPITTYILRITQSPEAV